IVPGWGIVAGPGMEFEKNKNLFIVRIGTEYEFELGNDWGISPSLNYDFKEQYSTWDFSIGLSKKL
ncbi:hypothetical protein, partial [Eudoraea sp.]|uniref:hypothetical protein n=1 Tax=Eudoraea sp. TaxID=1979955 RepID=UPI003C78626D